jgi:integrase/recombinase XerD
MAKRKFKQALDIRETLDEAFEEFMEEKTANNLSKSTLRNYRQSYDTFYKYHNLSAGTLLADINIQMFYKFINHLKNNEVRPQSINHFLRDLRTFFNWCNLHDKLQEPIKIKEIEAQDELPKMYSDDEMAIMLEKPRPGDGFSDWRSWAMISTVYATGLRASTLCALKLEDLNFQREEITIERQKNKNAGILPLTPALANSLKEYIKRWMKDADPTDFLFPSITGEQFNVGALNHAIDRYCKARGIEGHGIHSIRHNFSRDMIINGAGEYRLQKYLQHSSIQMSQHYVKLFAQDLKRGAEEFSPLDNAKKKQKRTSAFKKSNS